MYLDLFGARSPEVPPCVGWTSQCSLLLFCTPNLTYQLYRSLSKSYCRLCESSGVDRIVLRVKAKATGDVVQGGMFLPYRVGLWGGVLIASSQRKFWLFSWKWRDLLSKRLTCSSAYEKFTHLMGGTMPPYMATPLWRSQVKSSSL